MTFDERVRAVEQKGFTERQARFLTTVMLHAGVCVPRQYARFCGIVYGAKTRKFFAKLVRLRCASMYDCRHNRARIYHVNQRSLYAAIGEAESRLRKPVTLNHAIQRLMVPAERNCMIAGELSHQPISRTTLFQPAESSLHKLEISFSAHTGGSEQVADDKHGNGAVGGNHQWPEHSSFGEDPVIPFLSGEAEAVFLEDADAFGMGRGRACGQATRTCIRSVETISGSRQRPSSSR